MEDETTLVGLCEACRHADVVQSGRGGVFSRCLLSRHDRRFPKYPYLPVLRCVGFQPKLATNGSV